MAGGGRVAGRGGGSVSRGLAQVADPASVGHITAVG